MADLLQISSAYGRAMETVDRDKLCNLVFPLAVQARANNRLSASELSAIISSTAEGDAFPTSLDRDPPINRLAPET